jgi:hypothetical protein
VLLSDFRGQYNTWFSNPANKFYTYGGDMCAPRFAQVFEWISNSWNNLSSEIIIKSFTECGIGATVTGSFHNYLKEALENGNYLFYNFLNAYRHFYIIIKFNLSRV